MFCLWRINSLDLTRHFQIFRDGQWTFMDFLGRGPVYHTRITQLILGRMAQACLLQHLASTTKNRLAIWHEDERDTFHQTKKTNEIKHGKTSLPVVHEIETRLLLNRSSFALPQHHITWYGCFHFLRWLQVNHHNSKGHSSSVVSVCHSHTCLSTTVSACIQVSPSVPGKLVWAEFGLGFG